MTRLHLTVAPGAKTSAVVSAESGDIRIQVHAPPVDGKANRELVSFLSAVLGVPPSYIVVVAGHGARHKVVDVDGLTAEDALQRLAAAL